MSFAVMAAVWSHSRAKGIAKYVLLALADHAKNDGRGWAVVDRLADKTGLGRRTVQRALRDLESLGELIMSAGGGRGRPSSFRIVLPGRAVDEPPERASERHPFHDEKGVRATPFPPGKGARATPFPPGKGAKSARKGCQERAPESPKKGARATPKPVYSRSRSQSGAGLTPPPTPSPSGKGFTPHPPSQARGARNNGRINEADDQDRLDAAAARLGLTPSPEDVRLWDRARRDLAVRRVNEETRRQVDRLRLVGRRSDGALVFVAPPGEWWHGLDYYVRPVLKRIGDPGRGRFEVVRVPEVDAAIIQAARPPSADDIRVWDLALRELRRRRISKSTLGKIGRLSLVGRQADGSLLFRAAPGQGRYLGSYVSSALVKVGDPGGGRVCVMEVAP